MSAESSPLEKRLGDLKSGLVTTARLDVDPPALTVGWIAWDSGFRGHDLEAGDEILAVNGEPLARPGSVEETQRIKPRLLGQYAESQVWAEQGLSDGAPLSLSVRRRILSGEGWSRHEVTAPLRAERIYYDARQRRSLGPGGPDKMLRDDFDSAWGGWYERRVKEWTRVLDGGWRRNLNTRMALDQHLEEKPRIDFRVEHYPGPFADACAADWQVVRACLAGREYRLGPDDLEYRQLGDLRAARVGALTDQAWDAFVAAGAAETISAFPAIDPFVDDPAQVAGRLVVLPAITPRSWVVDMDRSFLASGQGGSWYFAAADSPAMRRLFDAMERYQRHVTPKLREDIELVGRIQPDPKLMVVQRRGVAGLEVEPLAARVGGGAMFVDLTAPKDGESPFAGEAEIAKLAADPPAADATPRAVLEAAFAALKAGVQDLWEQLFVDWRVVPDEKQPIYYAFYPYPPRRNSDWIDARRLLLDRVYDARVIWVDEPRVVLREDAFPEAPRIEEVEAEVDHVGLFGGEYRAFNAVVVRRLWKLQRRDGGPWRIATHDAL